MRPWIAATACALVSCQVPWQPGERSCADSARLDFPVDLAAYAGGRGHIRPFGVHGGVNPEGHPGIDLFLDSTGAEGGIAVRASFSADIISITPETDYPGSSCIVLDSACVEVNLCHVVLDPGLQEGGSVIRGARLGTVGRGAGAEGAEEYALHFGTYSGRDADLACPADFLDPDTVRCRLGLEAGGEAPADCGYAPGTVTLMGRSGYAERQSREMTVRCADGTDQAFALPAENALCNASLPAADRARMESCLGSACAGVW